MSAPGSVVRALRDEMDAHHPTPCMPHWNRCCCACGRHDMSGRDAMVHHEQAVADAAFAASLEWAADNIDLDSAYRINEKDEAHEAELAAGAWLRTADKP